MCAKLQPAHILVEGDLDFASHDRIAELAFYSQAMTDREDVHEILPTSLEQYCTDHIARLRTGKGVAGAARRRFDFMLASSGWVMKVACLEFKSTAGGRCQQPPSMRAYRRFIARFASRDHGTAQVRHVSSVVTPSDFTCTCASFAY